MLGRSPFLSALANSRRVLYGGLVFGSGGIGFMALWLVERKREPEFRSHHVATSESSVQRQNEALREMLKRLEKKTFREKIEDAVDAHGKFVGPQFADTNGVWHPMEADPSSSHSHGKQ
mmetsp:Transcript_47272/g.107158  ORF Transcript_47272/g.107158 Transcript_47272/m.107158 type:complete len:119 (-) Transcript_47272:175-531(-)|eukprot:CAMPEP_0172627042 /NCGR_PEP_ID=MMETSP1068-20121228/154079_1 /TAXON_ID=35684 /ORGANISM="Pseudopedinella elastica, Strain CCMP716" /LENGTH=118 /DNA_ID=CAMNT_0013436813 /DNA_START=199 /DNA_END=555 /DNA_ORIENTATION=+